MGCLFGLILYILFAALSWAFVVGLSGVICTCLGLMWSVKIATGVWLILIVLFALFGGNSKK